MKAGGEDDSHTTDETVPLDSRDQVNAEVGPDGPAGAEDGDGDGGDESGRQTLTPEELDALDTLVGQTLSGRYKVLDRLGSGGMSIVYRARHEMLKQFVAVKVLKRRLAADRVSLTRFHREAMAAASIGDPHIVHITDYGFTKQGDAYIVMEYLEGMSLRQTVRAEGALAVGRAVSVSRQILSGLAAAHDQGIVHRDLKGDNVFLTSQGGRDFVKLLDFGISKITRPMAGGGDSTGLTSTGVVMGTPQYIAPEQASGLDEVDHRADLYALGVIMYEMLTGDLPFEGRTPLEILMKHVQDEPVPPRKRKPALGIPPDIEAVVMRALKKDPGDRFESAEAMKAALPRAADLPGGFSSGPLTPTQTMVRARRWGTPLAVGLGALLLAGAIAALVGLRRPGERPGPVAPKPTPVAAPISAAPDLKQPAASAQLDAGTPRVAMVTLEVVTEPRKARILRDGVDLGIGGVKLRLERGEPAVKLEARATGYRRKEIELPTDRSRRVTITLERQTRKPKPKNTGKPKEIKDNPYKK